MDRKVLNPKPVAHLDYTDISEPKKYPLPHAFKYIAWLFVITTVVSTSTVLCLYATAFGVIKTFTWLVGFLMCFLIAVFLTPPVQILFSAIFNSIFRTRSLEMIRKKVPPDLVLNPVNELKKRRVLNFRLHNRALYRPVPLSRLRNRTNDIKYNLELQCLASDILVYGSLLFAGLYIVYVNKPSMAYYSNRIIEEIIMNGTHTDSIKFCDVKTLETLLKYFNETMLPSLLLDPKYNSLDNERMRRSVPSWEDNEAIGGSHDSLRKRQILDNNFLQKNKFMDKGWTINPNVKLLGKIRLRQVRVKRGPCKQIFNLVPRNLECSPSLNLINFESRDFTLGWKKGPALGLTADQADPWKYREAFETGSLPVFGTFAAYHAGGYVLYMPKNIDNSRIVLNFIRDFEWVDMSTRALFIEFTLYCVNTNLFNVVTLFVERTTTGYFITSYEVDTCKFLYYSSEFWFSSVLMTFLYSLVLFFLIFRESLRIHRTSFKLYIKRVFSIIDVTLILLGAFNLVFIVLRAAYVNDLVYELDKSSNNDFVSFSYAAFWHIWTRNIEAFLVCFASFKLLRLLSFKVVFFRMEDFLTQSFLHILTLFRNDVILINGFALFFLLSLINCVEMFSDLRSTISHLFGQTLFEHFVVNKSFCAVHYFVLVPLFFFIYYAVICIIFIDVFVAVMTLYFQKVENASYAEKYDIAEYLRFWLTLKRQKDILPAKEEMASMRKTDIDVMRLKGGGEKMSKLKIKRCKPCSGKRYWESTESTQTFLSEFVEKKPDDMTRYTDLPADRAEALRNFTILLLTNEEKILKTFIERAIKALFLCFIVDKKVFGTKNPNYFFFEQNCRTLVCNKKLLVEMKKVVENFGKERGLVKLDEWYSEIPAVEEKLAVLDNLLGELLKKLNSKKEYEARGDQV